MNRNVKLSLIAFLDLNNNISFKINNRYIFPDDIKAKSTVDYAKRSLFLVYQEIKKIMQRQLTDQKFELFQGYRIWYSGPRNKLSRTTKPVIYCGITKTGLYLFRSRYLKFQLSKESIVKFERV